jgi:eukaryotic-like serine/threonine-protein kinase
VGAQQDAETRLSETKVLPAARIGEFCPVGGFIGGSTSAHFREEIRCLLGRRLRNAAHLCFGGFAAFLVRNLVVGQPDIFRNAELLVPHVAVTVVVGALAIILWKHACLSLRQLRTAELLLFGLPAAFFVWIQYCRACVAPPEELAIAARAFAADTVIPWLILIHIYGLFIPNHWRRTAVVVALMAALPIIGAVGTAAQHPEIAESLYSGGGLSGMGLWAVIAAATSVYGSYRFSNLQQEAFDARQIGSYTLREKLGSGGMGEVYLAEHQMLKRPCALKLIKPDKADDPQAVARFETEVQATARLTHLNTVEIFDYGHTADGTFYYVMEYLPGLNLQDLVQRYGPLPPERVVYLLRQVCSALREAHRVGLIHRDIKPGNIFAAERGGVYDVAKLLDFGLVKSMAPRMESLKLTMDGSLMGSPLYAAPEMAFGDGHADARTDIYSLGATAYFLLTGQPVFQGENALRVLYAHANEPPKRPSAHVPNLPDDLESIILKCLEKEPSRRYADVIQLETALERCQLLEPWTPERAARWWRDAAESTQRVDSGDLEETTVRVSLAVRA